MVAGSKRDTLDVMAHQGEGGTISLAAVPTLPRWLIRACPSAGKQHLDIVHHIETQTCHFLFADTTFDAALYAGTAGSGSTAMQAQLLMHEEVVPCAALVCWSRLPHGAVGDPPASSTRSLASLPCCSRARAPMLGDSGLMRWRCGRTA